MRYGVFRLCILACTFVLANSMAFADINAQRFRALSFNHGYLELNSLKKAIEEGQEGKWLDERPDGDRRIVRHLRIETFNTNGATSDNQRTYFAMCETVLAPSVLRGTKVEDLKIEYVVLMHNGIFANPMTWKLIPIREKNGWSFEVKKGQAVLDFHRSLPKWAQEELWLLSGFLSQNQGFSPIGYSKAEAEISVGMFLTILEHASGPKKKGALRLTESEVNMFSLKSPIEILKGNKAYWGMGMQVSNEMVERAGNRDQYVKAGEIIWSTRPSPAWLAGKIDSWQAGELSRDDVNRAIYLYMKGYKVDGNPMDELVEQDLGNAFAIISQD